jgi:phosphatidylglycerol:prolipoprotein diacylglycerol transferase
VLRFPVEFIRVPDDHIGYLAFDWLTMGQILSAPMVIAGATLMWLAYRWAGGAETAPAAMSRGKGTRR